MKRITSVFWVVTAVLMLFPALSGAQAIIYPPTATPVISAGSTARPVAVGPVATGGTTLSIQVSTTTFTAPMDMYLAVMPFDVPGLAQDIFLFASDTTLAPLSSAATWRAGVTSANVALLGNIPIDGLPQGTYVLFLLVTQAGSMANPILWQTSFIAGPPSAGAFAAPVVLAPLPGGSQSAPSAINAGGQIVGNAEVLPGQAVQAVTWTTAGGAATLLPALAGAPAAAFSAAHGNNDADQVVGESEVAGGLIAGVFWDPALGTATELPSLGGPSTTGTAFDINNAGQIVGESEVVFFQLHAVAWTIDATGAVSGPADLGALGGSLSSARAVNDAGIAVGEAQNGQGTTRPAMWKLNGVALVAGPVDMGTLPGHVSGRATGINEAGLVVGESQEADGTVHAVSWTVDPATGAVTAGPVDLGVHSLANGINGNSRIVGQAAGVAAAWDLLSLSPQDSFPVVAGSVSSQANGINSLGQVVGVDGGVGFLTNPLVIAGGI